MLVFVFLLHVVSSARAFCLPRPKTICLFFRVDDDDEVVDAEDHNLTIR